MFNSIFGDTTFDIMEMIAPTASPTSQLFQHIEGKKQNLAVEMLDDIKLELDLGTRNEGGNTPLALASAYGMDLVVPRILARRPESIDEISGSRGATALHLASSRSHTEVVKILLNHDADTELLNSQGLSALDVAQSVEIKDLIRGARIAKLKKRNEKKGEYTHSDGKVEVVTVIKEHSDAEGGGYTIYVPSLERERQTVSERLRILDSETEVDKKEEEREKH